MAAILNAFVMIGILALAYLVSDQPEDDLF